MSSNGNLESRITKLEQRHPGAKRDQWRAIVAAFVEGPEYDDHRDLIIDALCGDMPAQYGFEVRDGPDLLLYHLNFWQRDEPGGEPFRYVIRIVDVDDMPLPPGGIP